MFGEEPVVPQRTRQVILVGGLLKSHQVLCIFQKLARATKYQLLRGGRHVSNRGSVKKVRIGGGKITSEWEPWEACTGAGDSVVHKARSAACNLVLYTL